MTQSKAHALGTLVWGLVRDTYLTPTTRHPLDGKVAPVGHSVEHTRKAMLSSIAYKNKLAARKAAMPEWLRELMK